MGGGLLLGVLGGWGVVEAVVVVAVEEGGGWGEGWGDESGRSSGEGMGGGGWPLPPLGLRG